MESARNQRRCRVQLRLRSLVAGLCYAGPSVQLNDWLTATLSVLAISLTILGVLVAVIAVWGYRSIKEEAKTIADPAAKQQISSYLDSEAIQD